MIPALTGTKPLRDATLPLLIPCSAAREMNVVVASLGQALGKRVLVALDIHGTDVQADPFVVLRWPR